MYLFPITIVYLPKIYLDPWLHNKLCIFILPNDICQDLLSYSMNTIGKSLVLCTYLCNVCTTSKNRKYWTRIMNELSDPADLGVRKSPVPK